MYLSLRKQFKNFIHVEQDYENWGLGIMLLFHWNIQIDVFFSDT